MDKTGRRGIGGTNPTNPPNTLVSIESVAATGNHLAQPRVSRPTPYKQHVTIDTGEPSGSRKKERWGGGVMEENRPCNDRDR